MNDKLIAINGELIIGDWAKFSKIISEHPEQNVNLTIERNNHIQQLKITPARIERSGKFVGYLGVMARFEPYPKEYLFEMRYGIVDAFGQSLQRSWNLVVLSFDMIGNLFTGTLSLKALSGPVSIAQGAGNSAQYGLVSFLSFLAIKTMPSPSGSKMSLLTKASLNLKSFLAIIYECALIVLITVFLSLLKRIAFISEA